MSSLTSRNTRDPSAKRKTQETLSLSHRDKTNKICSLLLKKINENNDLDSPKTSIEFNIKEANDLLTLISEVQILNTNESSHQQQALLQVKNDRKVDGTSTVLKSSRRRMSAFDHEKEMSSQKAAIGFDLDSSTLKHVQHFTGMIEQDGVRHSSSHIIARLKHAVKHTIVIEHLKKIGSREMIKLLKQQKSEGSHELHEDLDHIDSWNDFNIFHLLETFNGDRNLTVRSIAVEIIEKRHQLLTTLGVNQRSFLNYVNIVCDTYNNIPYHNCIHGGDVLQSLHCILQSSNVLREATPPTMMFACLVAALVHDVGHVGRTNHFLVLTSHEYALKFNDQSVLENMHIAKALELTKEVGCDIFEHFSQDSVKEIRSVFITMILGTDNAHHVRFTLSSIYFTILSSNWIFFFFFEKRYVVFTS